jgi:photosystem II oxygen-evolving enhancer protein 2
MAQAICASSAVAKTFAGAASLQSTRSNAGTSLALPTKVFNHSRVSCSVESKPVQATRRAALAGLLAAGVAAVTLHEEPALAAYGQSANIFAEAKKDTNYIPYKGDGFSLAVPSKWNPSKETEFPNVVLRYEDNFDALSHLLVIKAPAGGKSSIDAFGSKEDFLNSVSYLLGKQAYSGKTASEGGFDNDKVSAANILQAGEEKVNGKTYYKYELLTRTADGNEGGRHQLVVATVSNGTLYLLKAQAGDKRWFKGTEKLVRNVIDSFQVA